MAKVYVIDGKNYVEVDRKATVGDYVIITELDGYKVKAIRKVAKMSTILDDFYVNEPVGSHGATYVDGADDKYKTLGTLESEECCDNPGLTDLVANLARRVHSLERQLADTQRNLETFAEQTESNTQDIAFLDKRTQPQSAEVVTFEKFLDSIADKVAQKLVGCDCE
jgi:hypothetical protein